MVKKHQLWFNAFNAFTDGLLVLGSYFLASWLWLDVVKGIPGNMADVENFHGSTALSALIYAAWTVLLLIFLNTYRTSRSRRRNRLYKTILLGNTVAVITAGTVFYLFRLVDFSRGVLGLYYIFSCISMVGKRMLMHQYLRRIRAKGYNLKHVLVIGTGHLADVYIGSVNADPALGLRVDEHLYPGDTMLKELEEKLYNSGIDEVVLALDIGELQVTADVIRVCEKCGTKISVIPFYNDVIPTRPTIESVGNTKLIRLRTTPLDEPFNALLKRSFDIFVSAVLLLILSPVLLILAVATKLSSPGPIIFRQERVGLNKKNFTMLKFRSMRQNSKESSGWSGKTDSRRTVLGSIMRKTSLDELPQLWNVLIGDMSLVGPRPEVPFFVDQFRETVPLYMVKHQVRPGITGWAQINGYRGDTSIPERIKHDLWYIENWSFFLDLEILFRTAFGGMVNQEQLDIGNKQ